MDLSPAGSSPVAGIYMNESDESDESDYVDGAEEVDVYSELDLHKPDTSQGRRLAALISVSILVTLGLCATGLLAYYFTVGGGAPSTVEDIDECADHNGGCGDRCINTLGSYICECTQPGQTLSEDGHNCHDVNECDVNNGGCEDRCNNTVGSYLCDCLNPGLRLANNGHTCTDIDECADKNGGCEDCCINTLGSYICECTQPGQTLSEDGHNCHDVNECDVNNGGCEDRCINTVGSYLCDCLNPGLRLANNGHTCTDINECADNNGGCVDRCINTLGSYICECTQPGRTLSEDGPNCHGCIRMADLTFVIDASGSINEQDEGNWDRVLNFVASVMQDPQFVISLSNVRVGAVVYSNFARVEFYLSETTNADDMAGRVRSFSYDRGTTNIADALRKARREVFNEQSGDRPDAPNILVLLTDGRPNEAEGNTRPEVEMARQAGINIIGIGVTSEIDLTLLSDIATRPVLTAERFSDLTSLVAQTVALICDTTPTN